MIVLGSNMGGFCSGDGFGFRCGGGFVMCLLDLGFVAMDLAGFWYGYN